MKPIFNILIALCLFIISYSTSANHIGIIGDLGTAIPINQDLDPAFCYSVGVSYKFNSTINFRIFYESFALDAGNVRPEIRKDYYNFGIEIPVYTKKVSTIYSFGFNPDKKNDYLITSMFSYRFINEHESDFSASLKGGFYFDTSGEFSKYLSLRLGIKVIILSN